MACIKCGKPTFGTYCAACIGERRPRFSDGCLSCRRTDTKLRYGRCEGGCKPVCTSFGADPDCRPEPKRPWDNRGWNPNEDA